MKKTHWIPLAAGLLLASGCGTKQDVASSGDKASAATATRTSTSLTTPSEPKEVVQLFLDSMREGNGAQLSTLLSSLAREEIKRKKLEIAPLGSPFANFKVNEAAEQEGGMLVSSTWTEPDQPGQPATELEVVWELRKEPAGWRICGMAVDPKNGEEVQIVDFERLEPDQPDQDPQRVATLPNSSTGFPTPSGLPPAGNYGPAPSGDGHQTFNSLPPAIGFQTTNLPLTNLPPSNFPGGQQTSGLPQPNGQFGNQNQLPPIVPGNYNLPPAGNYQPPTNDLNQIRR